MFARRTCSRTNYIAIGSSRQLSRHRTAHEATGPRRVPLWSYRENCSREFAEDDVKCLSRPELPGQLSHGCRWQKLETFTESHFVALCLMTETGSSVQIPHEPVATLRKFHRRIPFLVLLVAPSSDVQVWIRSVLGMLCRNINP